MSKGKKIAVLHVHGTFISTSFPRMSVHYDSHQMQVLQLHVWYKLLGEQLRLKLAPNSTSC